MADPLAVTGWIPELEEDTGAENPETEAPDSTRKLLLEREYLRYRREDEILAGRKNFVPAGQLVFQPGGGLLALLGFVSVSRVEQTWFGDGRRRPLVAVRGSQSEGTSGGGGLRCR